MMSEIFTEECPNLGLNVSYPYTKKLFSEKSEFQKVEVFQTKGLGKVLANDDLFMCSEKDEFVYHEMIAHVPYFLLGSCKKVLVIGGGDGGTAREILRHSSVEKCVMVEIDDCVVQAAKLHLPTMSCSFKDPRLELIIDDGVKYMAESSELFDLILIDSTDPIGPATPLFGEQFYANVFKRLSDKGMVVSQCESPYINPVMQKKILSILHARFNKVAIYNYGNIGYPGPVWSFSLGSKADLDLENVEAAKVKASGLEFQYYNPKIHKASFALPEFQYQQLKEYLK